MQHTKKQVMEGLMEGYEDQERQRPGERELDGTVENYRERNGRQGTKAKKITY